MHVKLNARGHISIMSQLILLFIYTCVSMADITPRGGANCSESSQCGIKKGGGYCLRSYVDGALVGWCVCSPASAMSNCSYHRLSKDWAAMLQVGPLIVAIYGLGNWYLGLKVRAILQLCIGLCAWVVFIPLCYTTWRGLISMRARVGWACVVIVLMLCGSVWSLYDEQHMTNGDYVDSNGYGLY
jgi:hypothetical protein